GVKWSCAIRRDWGVRQLSAVHTRRTTASTALQPPGNPRSDGFLRNLEPDRCVERGVQTFQNRRQTFRLRKRPWKSIEHKAVASMETQPIFNQLYDDFVRNQIPSL